MADIPVVMSHERIYEFSVSALVAMKMAQADAETTAALMIRTDLRGVDSHGMGMLPRYYERWQAGYIVMDAQPVVVRDDAATALLDAQKGLGHPVSSLAMGLCIEKAKAYGTGVVTVRQSNHYGAAANYAMMALDHDLIGISTTNSALVVVAPTFGRTAKLATNPISFAAPAGRHAPFVLDMATSTVAFGKLTVAARWKKPIPSGWALDAGGLPTTDAEVAMANPLLTPLGGTRELGSHKGYGLAVMVDILSGILSGAVYGDLLNRSDMAERGLHNVGHCFIALDPARFRPLEEFKRDMDDMFDSLKATPRVEGQDRIYVAGEPEAESEARRRVEGVPLAPALVNECNELAARLGIPPLR
jgi:L-2-hydroxycarboxylate dehydrogenase (NAD+)